MTAQGAVATVPEVVAGGPYAPWWRRLVAALLDDALLAGVVWVTAPPVLADAALGGPSLTPMFSAGTGWIGPWGWAALLALLMMQAYLGSTPGKLVLGLVLLDRATGRPLGPGRTLLRWLAHLIDAIVLIGYLRPLWNARRQTFADSMLGSVVVTWLPRPGWRRPAAMASAAACALGIALGTTVSVGSADTYADCPVTVVDRSALHLTDVTLIHRTGLRTETRLGISHTLAEPGGAETQVAWTVGPLDADGGIEVSAEDGDVRVQLVDAAGARTERTATLAESTLTMPVPDGVEVRSVVVESLVDGRVTARCRADL